MLSCWQKNTKVVYCYFAIVAFFFYHAVPSMFLMQLKIWCCSQLEFPLWNMNSFLWWGASASNNEVMSITEQTNTIYFPDAGTQNCVHTCTHSQSKVVIWSSVCTYPAAQHSWAELHCLAYQSFTRGTTIFKTPNVGYLFSTNVYLINYTYLWAQVLSLQAVGWENIWSESNINLETSIKRKGYVRWATALKTYGYLQKSLAYRNFSSCSVTHRHCT